MMIPMLLVSAVIFLGWTCLMIVLVNILYNSGLRSLAQAPMLDIAVALMIWGPWIVGAVWAGWAGLIGCWVGQYIGLELFCMIHPILRGKPGDRIKNALDRRIGRFGNRLALLATSFALPTFLMIRLAEVAFYPMLIVLARFPRYRHGQWVNVSRHKFDGLVGHDLFWCLYCDWMTGVYMLGLEMLRNVESFWCPIKFSRPDKCTLCAKGFPDVRTWVPSNGKMDDVVELIDEQYPMKAKTFSWFGHPKRGKKK